MSRLVALGERLSTGPVTAFVLFGGLGVAVAAALGPPLAASRGWSPWLPLYLVALGVVTIVGFGHLTRWAFGVGALTFYQHAMAFLTLAAATLALAGRPVRPGLDLAVFMTAVFQGLGRLGCLSVGCCHGRPHPGGVRYPGSTTRHGFLGHWVGIPLFPVQLVEAALLTAIAAACAAVILSGQPAGAAAATWGVLYAVVRFSLEELRGDAARPYAGGLSEAQWTSVALATGVLLLEAAGLLPLVAWHLAWIALAATASAVWLAAQGRSRGLLRAGHLDELAGIAQLWTAPARRASAPRGRPMGPVRTGAGILLSWESSRSPAGTLDLVAFSSAGAPLAARPARRLARTLQAVFDLDSSRLVPGSDGVFFLVSTSDGPFGTEPPHGI